MNDFKINIGSQLDLDDSKKKIDSFISKYNNKKIILDVELGKDFNANAIVNSITNIQNQVAQKLNNNKLSQSTFVKQYLDNLEKDVKSARSLTKTFGGQIDKINKVKYDGKVLNAINAFHKEQEKLDRQANAQAKKNLQESIREINKSNAEKEKLERKNFAARKKYAESLLQEELSLISRQASNKANLIKNQSAGNTELVQHYKNERKNVKRETDLIRNELKKYDDIIDSKTHNQILKNKNLESKSVVDKARAGITDSIKLKDFETGYKKTMLWLKKNSKAEKEFGQRIRELGYIQRHASSNEEYDTATKQIKSLQLQAQLAGKTGRSFVQEMGRGFKQIGQFVVTYGVLQQLPELIFRSANELKEMDNILTEISKTSDLTNSQLKELGSNSFEKASEFGKTANDYLLGVQEMSRSGFYGKQAEDLAKLSIMGQAAGDMTADVSNKYLLATNAAYEYKGSVEKLNAVLDGQNMITNRNSVSMNDMSMATSKAASMAAQTGVQVNELSAIIGTAVSRTKQEGNTIGTALKSLFVNLQDTSNKKIVSTFDALNISQTKMVNGSRQLKTPIELLKELAKAYNELPEGSKLKSDVLRNIGQKRQANVLAAILGGIGSGDYDKMLLDYSEGKGSAYKESLKSANNITGSLSKLSNAWNSFIHNFANSDSIITATNALTGFIKVLDKLASHPILLTSGVVGGLSFLKNLDSLKAVGQYTDVVKGFKDTSDIVKAINNLDDIEEVGKLLNVGKVSKKTAKDAISKSNFANKIDDILDLTDNLPDATNKVDNLGMAFKGLGIQLKSLIFNPVTLGILAVGSAAYLVYRDMTKFQRGLDKAKSSKSSYDESKNELNGLQDELKITSDRIKELESQDKLTITEATELEKLKLQNAELERQYSLKEKIVRSKQKEAQKDAKELLGSKSADDLTIVKDMYGNGSVRYGKSDIITATSNELSELERLKNKRKSLLKELSSKGVSKKQKDEINKQINAIDTAVGTFEESLSKKFEDLSSIHGSLEGTKEYDVISQLMDDFANIDLSSSEKSLKNLTKFFSSTGGRNAIKKELEEAYKSGQNLDDVLSRMGLTLDDLGIDSIDRLNSYLAETTHEAENAKKSIQDYSATVEDVAGAAESANQDNGWLTIQEQYKVANELLKEGKTGTDDFQSMASFLNPARVKELADKGGKYIADAYQQAFEEAKVYGDRWFGEDQAISMKNFVNDFKDKKLFNVSTDEKGLWNIDANFKTSAEAANEFGISVQAVETMLHSLEAYGYDFSNITFSADGFARFETSLNGIKQIAKELGEDSRFAKMLPGWQEEYDKISDDLTLLDETKIVQIEFEYSLAQIQSEINRLQAIANEGGDTKTWAELNANKREYRSKSESRDGNLSSQLEEYQRTSDLIVSLQNQMKNAVDDTQKQYIQSQISGLYDLQNELNDMFVDSGKSWEEFIKTEEFNNKINELTSSSEKARDVIAELFGVKPEDIHVDVDADTSKAEKKLTEIKDTHIMLDANDEEIMRVLESLKETAATGTAIVFTANVDGVKTEVTAVKNEDGTISYIANMGGVEYYLQQVKNEDGTINYTIGECPEKVPDATQNVNRNPKNPRGIFDNLKGIYQTVTRKIKTIFSGESQLDGTAHLKGTAYTNGSVDGSFIKDEWKTSKGEVALTGEVAPEIVVNGNKWWTVGDNGAEFSYIPPNSVVFNAQQSKDLLEKGYITSRGTAHLSGTAYRLGSNTSSTAGSKKSSKSNKSSGSSKDKFEEIVDWIEILLERVSRITKIAIDEIDNAVGLIAKQSKTTEALEKTQNEIIQNQKAKDAYLQKANSVDLSSSYKESIKNGRLSIETVTDENLKKKIDEYKKWYDAAQKCEDAIRDLNDQEKELSDRRLKNIEEWHDAIIDMNKSLIDITEAKQELNQMLGTAINLDVNTSEIKKAIKIQQETYNQLVGKLADYEKEFNSQVSSGKIKEGSDSWYKGKETINKFNAEVIKSSVELIKFQDKLREIEYDTLQHLIDGFERAFSKIDAHISLLESRDEIVPESMYVDQINNNNSQIKVNKELRDKKLAEQSFYDIDSDRYQELAEEIQKIDEDTLGLLESNEKLKNSIFELRFTPLDEALEKYDKLNDELNTFNDLLNEDAFFDKDGNATAELAAHLAIIQQQMGLAKQKIADYKVGLNKLQESLDNGVISQKEFNEKSEEYRKGIQENVVGIKKYEDSLKELYITQMKNEVEATEKIIDKYSEARKQKESFFQYDKRLKNQQKSVDLLKAEIAALDGVNNSYALSQKKRLEAELAQQQDSLDEIKRTHRNEMMDMGDDKIKKDLSTMVEETEYAITHSVEKQESVIDSMLNRVLKNYENVFGKINNIIGNTGWVGSNEFNNTQSQLGTQSGAQSQKDSAIQHHSGSNAANSTITDKVNSNDSFNQSVEQEITSSQNADRKVAEIKLDPTTVSIEEGNSTSVSATFRPNDAKNKSVVWSSSDKNIANVSGGTIHAISPGSCTITATTTDGSGLSATVSVTVTAKPEPPKPTITPPVSPTIKPSVSSGGDGVPRVGDRVTFVSGKYYYDSEGKKPAGSKYQGKTVYITKINGKSWAKRPIHISTGTRLGSGDLGWLTKEQLSGYASGTRGITSGIEIARIDEQGKELRIKRGGSKYDIFQYGDGVVPKGLTDNLFTLAQHTNEVMANLGSSKLVNNVEITQNYDSLLTVNGDVDKNTLPELKELLKQSCEYTVKHINTELKKNGFRR